LSDRPIPFPGPRAPRDPDPLEIDPDASFWLRAGVAHRISQDAREVCPELWRWIHEGGAEPLVPRDVRERFFALLAERDQVWGDSPLPPSPLAG
jgi:hypothetical protein